MKVLAHPPMFGNMLEMDEIGRFLGQHDVSEVASEGKRQAAVAMVLRAASEGPEVLFIERARHEADPWSGHMAFPGGRVDPGDPDPRAAAERETFEEVGLEIHGARYLGRLPDLTGRGAAREAGLVISGHVYFLEQDRPLRIDANEVQQAFWFPLSDLQAVDRQDADVLVDQRQRRDDWCVPQQKLAEEEQQVGAPFAPEELLAMPREQAFQG